MHFALRVMLDLHHMQPERTTHPSGSVSDVELMKRTWALLAEKLCDAEKYWNLFGFDLRNEPYEAHWGAPAESERWRNR